MGVPAYFSYIIKNYPNIKISIIGFDSGSGLPEVKRKEDLPFFWKAGDYTNENINHFLNKRFVVICNFI